MNIDEQLLSAIIDDGKYSDLVKEGINEQYFVGEFKKAFSYAEECIIEYGSPPSRDLFETKTGIFADRCEESIELLVSEIKKRYKFNVLRSIHEEFTTHLENNDVDSALETIKDGADKAVKSVSSGGCTVSIMDVADDVVSIYDRVKSGERGIKTPWPTMDGITLGWWPGDFAVFVARVGVGKTFGLLNVARAAWTIGKNVLYIGTEMTSVSLSRRFLSIHLGIPYGDLRSGALTTEMENRLKTGVEEMKDRGGFSVAGDNLYADMNGIKKAVDSVEPDLLIVDGLYLVKNKITNDRERLAAVVNDLKHLSLTSSIPIIGSTQLNRDADPDDEDSLSIEKIGISDTVGWVSDYVFALFCSEEMRADGLMNVKPLKMRDSNYMGSFSVNWNFDTMDFSEISGNRSSGSGLGGGIISHYENTDTEMDY